MAAKKPGIGSGRTKGAANYTPNYAALEQFAACRMTVTDICNCLGIAESLFYKKQKTDKKFREALKRGRSVMVAKCSQTVTRQACDEWEDVVDTKTGTTRRKLVRPGDAKLALQYLQLHTEEWKPQATQVRHSGQVASQVSVGGQIQHTAPQLDIETQLRMAKAFLKIQGEEVTADAG